MPFQEGVRLDDGDDLLQELAQGLALFSQGLALGTLEVPVGRMAIEHRPINPILFQNAGHFSLHNRLDLPGYQDERFLPMHRVQIST